MKKVILGFCLVLFGGALWSQAVKKKDETAIYSILERQTDCWNEGKLECFMKGYWENDSLRFIGKSGVTYGWDATLERYKKGYPDRAAMGQLTFSKLEMVGLGKKSVLVIGEWHLKREADDLGGHFSLVWKKIKGEWVIIADHSS